MLNLFQHLLRYVLDVADFKILIPKFILLSCDFFWGNESSVFHSGFQSRFPFYSDKGLECSFQSGLFNRESSTIGGQTSWVFETYEVLLPR